MTVCCGNACVLTALCVRSADISTDETDRERTRDEASDSAADDSTRDEHQTASSEARGRNRPHSDRWKLADWGLSPYFTSRHRHSLEWYTTRYIEHAVKEWQVASLAWSVVWHSSRKKVKVKEVDLYSAFIVVPHTQGAQVRITQCSLQITPYLALLYLVSIYQMAHPQTEVADI